MKITKKQLIGLLHAIASNDSEWSIIKVSPKAVDKDAIIKHDSLGRIAAMLYKNGGIKLQFEGFMFREHIGRVDRVYPSNRMWSEDKDPSLTKLRYEDPNRAIRVLHSVIFLAEEDMR